MQHKRAQYFPLNNTGNEVLFFADIPFTLSSDTEERRREEDVLNQWLLPSMTGVLSFPFSSPPLGGSRVMSCGSITKHQLYISRCSSSPSSSPSIRPDYTSNGSLSQQPPTVMESCSGEHPLLCTSAPPPSTPFLSLLLRFKHTSAHKLISFNVHFCRKMFAHWIQTKRREHRSKGVSVHRPQPSRSHNKTL